MAQRHVTSSHNEERPLLEPRSEFRGIGAPYSRLRRLSCIFLLLGEFCANADGTFVIVTYNEISADLGTLESGAWLLVAETLAFTISLPICGSLEGRFGQHRMVLAAFIIFAAGCLVSAFLPGFALCLVGRLITGCGGAGITALATTILTKDLPPSESGIMRSYANVFAVAGRATGGPLGASLTDVVGWQWAFFAEAVVSLVCGLGVFGAMTMEDEPAEATSLDGEDDSVSIDWQGIVALTLVMVFSTLSLQEIGNGVRLRPTLVFSSAFLLSVLALAVIEKRAGQGALIDFRSSGSDTMFQLGMVALLGHAQSSIITHIPTYYYRTINASTTFVALAALPTTAGNIVGSLAAGKMIRRFKIWRLFAFIGLQLCCIGYALLAVRWISSIRTVETLYPFVSSLGYGAFNLSQFVAMTTNTRQDRTAIDVSLYFMAQNIGMMTGTGASDAISRAIFRAELNRLLPDKMNRGKVMQEVLNNLRFAYTLPRPIMDTVIMSYRHSFAVLCVTSGGLAFVLQPLLLRLKRTVVE